MIEEGGWFDTEGSADLFNKMEPRNTMINCRYRFERLILRHELAMGIQNGWTRLGVAIHIRVLGLSYVELWI